MYQDLRKVWLTALVGGVLLAFSWTGASTAATTRHQDFEQWLQDLRQEALGQEISETTLETALKNIHPLPKVIKLDRRQPESTLTFTQYLNRVVPKRRVRQGRQKLSQFRQLLNEIGKHYGIQPRFIVALWGIETDFGQITGGFPVIGSLATLAYDGRRSRFFRGELIKALKILDGGHISADKMTGSWAGAMGQVQFMPSSFLRFAVDHNRDGRRDIWETRADAFASAANYLASSGWKGDQTWGREVRLPPKLDPRFIGHKTVKGLQEWQTLGIRKTGGGDLPSRNLSTSIIQPGGSSGPAYAIYANYRTLLKWNRSDYFATAVGILADRIDK
ncbi:MAG: lytic murein transglycosylase [Gammaproteobacteria bacterium]|nr:lytic murein transglycosylase [Gammaproteobacteria bacterium]